MTPVLTDTRGPFTFVIYSGATARPGRVSRGRTSPPFDTLQRLGAPPAGKIVPSFQDHTAHAGDAYSFIEGHAGDGVTAATST